MARKLDRKIIAIIVLSVALVFASVYIAYNELSKCEYQIYLNGVQYGNTQTLNTILQQIQNNGYADISILNGNNTTQTLRLVPMPVNATR